MKLGESDNLSLHRFAVLTASATLVLIFAGGLVTSTGSALAVPDWPLAFGKLIPTLKGGVRFEYGHRVVAAIVVLLTTVLAVWTLRGERRRWVRNTALAVLGLVVVQAILGGITVLFMIPVAIAVAHAATAQAFFCLTVALAIFTSPRFIGAESRREPRARVSLGTLCAITTGVIYIQILLGAVMRHLGAGLAIPDFPTSFGRLVPPVWNTSIAVNFAHRCGAVVVTCFVLWTVIRVLGGHRDETWLVRPARGLVALLAVQLLLGALTVWSGRAVLPTTAHVTVGAAVLATSLALTIRAWRTYGLTGEELEAPPGRSASAPSKVVQRGAAA
jgi:heme a synthase